MGPHGVGEGHVGKDDFSPLGISFSQRRGEERGERGRGEEVGGWLGLGAWGKGGGGEEGLHAHGGLAVEEGEDLGGWVGGWMVEWMGG